MHQVKSDVKMAKKIRRPVGMWRAVMIGGVLLSATFVPAETPSPPSPPPGAVKVPDASDGAVAVATPVPKGQPGTTVPPPSAGAKPPADAEPNEHPLMPVLRWAARELPAIENLHDYSTTLVKRERVNGRLRDREYLALKVRHKPFSVYINFLAPAAVRGQEVIYVEGQNRGSMWAHKAHLPGTTSLHPDSLMAMSGQRYPLTAIGLVNLVRRLVEVGQEDVRLGDCEVKYLTDAKVNQRACTVVQVLHPVRRNEFRYYLARVFVDDELKVPIRFESYDWPPAPGGQPVLLEEYTYLDLKLNVGLTDDDFSTKNPAYRFH
jgi:hypothetical protein